LFSVIVTSAGAIIDQIGAESVPEPRMRGCRSVRATLAALSASPSAQVQCRLGVLAFGDSITNGGGELQWGIALQSWALWVARALGLPFTSYAVDGARVSDVVRAQLPAFAARGAHPEAGYELGCLYIGVNDVRSLEWSATEFERDFTAALAFLRARCDRLLTVTAPLKLGLPAAGAKVHELDDIIERVSSAPGALIVDLRALHARNLVMADRVHLTALGQIALAERALAVLASDGLSPRIHPSSLVTVHATRWGRLRGDATYTYRDVKLRARALALGATRADGRGGSAGR
jgi:lysophospholipase L1-like esterase